MYAQNKKPIPFDKIDWNEFIELQESEVEEGPLIKIPFSLNTPYIQKDFNLDLIIWNLSDDTMELTKKVISYVLRNFDKLFETGWTILYYYLCEAEPYPEVSERTLSEFYKEQIDFTSPYYSIQLEINTKHLVDDIARYCFVVSTTCEYDKWMISDDNMRVYMVDNKCRCFDTNNDAAQMMGEDFDEYLYEDWNFSDIYTKMEEEGFQYAISFKDFYLEII